MWLLGVILAGLILLLRPVPGILKATSSGVIVRKGHGSPRVERSSEPERFRNLVDKRKGPLMTGILVFAVSVLLLAYQLLSLWLFSKGYR